MISNFISFKKKMLNKQNEKLLFYLMWVGIIISINTNSSLLYIKSYKFFEIINFFRALAPLVIFFILVFYFLINIKNLKYFENRNAQLNLICICILFYTAISIIGLFVNNNDFFFDRIWWSISYLNVLIYLYLSNNLFGERFLKIIFFILILFIFCFYTSIAFMTIQETVIFQIKNVYHSTLLSPNTFVLDQGMPRTSGVARAIFFLFLTHLSLLCFKKNYFYLNFCICFLYAWVISVFDSRITTIFYFISLLVIFYSKFNILKKLVIFLMLIMIFSNSQYIYRYIVTLYSEKIDQELISKKRSELLIENLVNNYFTKDRKNLDDSLSKEIYGSQSKDIYDSQSKEIRENDAREIKIILFKKSFYCDKEHYINLESSGRLCIWIDNLNTALKNYSVFFLGYGAQADRYNVKYTSTYQEQSASNIFIYVLTSGGIISVIFVLVIYIKFFITFLRHFIFTKEKLFNESAFFISCLLINFFILFRGITESSFAMFSLDYIVFLVNTFIIFSKKKFNYNKKIK